MNPQTLNAQTLDYDFDEEAVGFGEPVTPEGVAPRGLSTAEKASLALVGLGLLSLTVQVFGGPIGVTWNGTWLGFLSSFGFLAVGGALTFRAQLKDTRPGIKHDGMFFKSLVSRGMLGWIAGILMTGIYVLLYFQPAYLGYAPVIYGSEGLVEPAHVTGGLVKTVEPLALALGVQSSQWFLYGVLYTLSILVFGVRMMMKYRHNRYHQIRTGSVMFFKTYLWPEKVHGQFLGAGSLGVALLVFAIAGVIATPVLTYFFGKRWYCSWVCGCGGLAETLGDPWRQLSSKSTRSWKIERWLIHSVLALVVATTIMLWVDYKSSGNLYGSWSGPLRQSYGFYIGAIFSGVVGVGFYPLLGNRVWCRFGCPQAAILGLVQRVFSRFRITTNGGQCMSCGNCSTYCEMGIDVRAYAQRSENIVRASCVGCGVCAAVCPRGVLRLENGAPGDRYKGADKPLTALAESFRTPSIHGYEAWKGCPTEEHAPRA